MNKNVKLRQLAYQYNRAIGEAFNHSKIDARLVSFAVGPRFFNYDIQLSIDSAFDWKRALDAANAIQAMTLVPNVVSEMHHGLIRYGVELETANWQQVYRSDMHGLEIGQAVGHHRVSMDWNQHSWHKLFAGTTGSGKSTLIASSLIGLAAEYEPGEVEVFIADPHGDYADNFRNYSLLGLPIANSSEDIQNLIAHVQNIYQRRKAENNRDAHKIVLVIDECQEVEALGNSETGFSKNLTHIIPIAKGGRKFQISLWLGSQRPLQKDMPGILDMLMGKFVGVTDRAQTGTYLTGQSKLDVHKLTGSGDMVYVSPEGVTRFVAALPRNRDYDALPRVEITKAIPETVLIGDATQKTTQPGPVAECLDDPKAIGFYLAHAIVNKRLPGRRVVERELGLSRHYHKRYDEHVREIIKYMIAYRKGMKP